MSDTIYNPSENGGVIQFSETENLLDIRNDNVFKAVFTKDTPKAKAALSGLVSDLIQRKVTIETITANEPPIETIGSKRIRFDISCRADKGEQINIEMSFNPERDELPRLEYYNARLHAGQGLSRNYKDLKETYEIAIIGKKTFFDDNSMIHLFFNYDPVNNVSLGGKTKIITVELEKTSQIINTPVEKMESYEIWSIFFQYLTNPEKRHIINQILRFKTEIAMAGETLITISRDEIERARLESEYKYEMDRQSALYNAMEKGMEMGIEKGIEKGIIIGDAKGEQRMRQYVIDLLDQGLTQEEIRQRITNMQTP